MADQIEDLDQFLTELKGQSDLSPEEVSAIDNFRANPRPDNFDSDLMSEKAEAAAPKTALQELQKETGDKYDVRTMLRDMELPGKIKLALYGNSTCRTILIMDANKILQACVLKNPKLGLNEVEEFAKNPNISQFVLRTIADRKEWLKSYTLKINITCNPKTPGDIALKWLKFLNEPDLRKISKSKNVSSLVSQAARKKVAELDKTRG